MDDKIISNEIEWHRKNVVGTWKPSKISSSEIEKYRLNPDRKHNSKQFMFWSMGELGGKRVLDFGSGQGINGVEIALLGAEVFGFDICPELVEESNELALLNAVNEKCRFVEGEATEIDLEQDSYDIVLIDNVLHHIPADDFSGLLDKLSGALKPDGKFIIREPTSLLPIVPRLRRAFHFRGDASPDERELDGRDLKLITENLNNAEIRYYNIFARILNFLGLSSLSDLAMKADRLFISLIPFSRFLAGYVVVVGGRK